MKKLFPPILALTLAFAATGCDLDEKRSGQLTLAEGSTGVSLIDRSGAATGLLGGPTELRIRRGSKQGTIAVRARQPGRGEINLELPTAGVDVRGGNFSLPASVIGQPVSIVSRRDAAITGSRRRRTELVDNGFERCSVDVSWDPCDENWSVDFRNLVASVGTFASRTPTQCNVERGLPYACWRQGPINPFPGDPRWPHDPRWPRDPRFPRGGYYEHLYQDGVRFH